MNYYVCTHHGSYVPGAGMNVTCPKCSTQPSIGAVGGATYSFIDYQKKYIDLVDKYAELSQKYANLADRLVAKQNSEHK